MKHMKQKCIALAMSAGCLLAVTGCSQSSAAQAPASEAALSEAASQAVSQAASSEAAGQDAEAADYLSSISGTYVELFPQLAKEEYRQIWLNAAAPLVGEENAEAATDMLLNMCMAEPYGAEAIEKYTADPDSAAFNCYFLGGVSEFVMDGDTITGLDENGEEVFSHSYQLLDEENENGFIFYGTEDADAGQFTYFAFSPDTMETTYHLEFRYAEDLDDLQSWYEGNYAYWNAAAIAKDYSEETMNNVINLFAEENLSGQES